MKNIILFIGFLSLTSLSFIKDKSNKDDSKFFGSWSGSETDNQRIGLSKHWIQHRFDDGTFILLFTFIENCEVTCITEKGEWWLKDGLFYELHYNSGKTDIYNYDILDENNIKFKAKKMGIVQVNSDYQFIDTKLNSKQSK